MVAVTIGKFLCCTSRFISLTYTPSALRPIYTSAVLNKLVDFKLSDIGEGIKEVAVKEWYVKVGDKVTQFDNLCEVQSDKASVTITSRYDGVINDLKWKIDDTVQVGETLLIFDVDDELQKAETPVETSAMPTKSAVLEKLVIKEEHKDVGTQKEVSRVVEGKRKALATPVVRNLAKIHNIDLSSVNGSGESGRVLKDDLQQLIQGESMEPTPKGPKIISLKGYAKGMFNTMSAALQIPHFVYSDEVNVGELVRLRTELKSLKELHEYKITYMPFFIKAVSLALTQYPIVNSQLDKVNERIVINENHNIGVAIDTKHGLVVPNIKNVENKSILEIIVELNSLIEQAVNQRLQSRDIVGGTFSLSNIGIIGGTYTKPVILPPQVAIGALGKIQILPRFDSNENVIKAHVVNVSWAADHRVIDGATMAKFSELWKRYIEHPNLLLLSQ